jgi:RHS repeat-associated protein
MMQSAVCAKEVCFSRSRYTAKERDAESGNDYFGARYYASSMGRFLSPDWSATVMPVPYVKLDNPQTLNLYAYVGNNPLSRTDPTGHYLCNGDECKQVKQALKDINSAIKSGNLSKDEKAALKDVVKFYGKAGKDNGVTVNTGVKGLTTEGGVGNTTTTNGKTTISLNMGALDKTVNQGSPGVEKAAAVAHEGEHGVQQQTDGMPSTPEQHYAAEQEAYTVQSYVNKGLNSDSDRNLWTSGPNGGFNENAVNENAADSTRLDIGNPNWHSPDE